MALQKSASHNEQNKLSMGLAAVVVGILLRTASKARKEPGTDQ